MQTGVAPLSPDAVVEDVISINQTPDLALPDEALVDPNAIVPDMPVAPPPAVTADSDAQKAREETVRYKQLRTRFEQDPEVANLREQAETAPTIEDRRAAMREYYRLLFKKIVAADKSLKERSQTMLDAYLRRLAQSRLEPTIPLNPPPTPQPLN
jgi:hypothetical protein